MSWILIVFVYAGMFSKSDSVSLTNIPGFSTKNECIIAGKNSEKLVQVTQKQIRFVCVEQTK